MKAAPARVGALLALVLALAGCAGIPTSGPVFTSNYVAEEPGQSYLRAPGPRKDASPVQIVTGFLNAQTGALTTKSPTGGFEVAQEFLTKDGAQSWVPTQKVVVYRGDPGFEIDGDDVAASTTTTTVRGSATLVGSVDAHGVYTGAKPDTSTDVVFDLTRVGGQWRIKAADGLVMSESNFERIYRATPLYFPTTDHAWFVPDVRWFPSRNWQTYAVRETLAGPSPWLAPSVTTVAPEGTTLAIESVPVEDTGPIKIRLNNVVTQASREDRALLTQQLEAVLSETGAPRTVQLYAGAELLNSDADSARAPTIAPRASDPAMVSGDEVVRLTGGKTQPVAGLAALDGITPTALAFASFGADGRFVVRDGSGRVATVPTANTRSNTLYTGDDVLGPSVDRFGFVWTGTRVQDGSLAAVARDGSVTNVAASWLAGRTVQSIRVAPDGARIAVVSSGPAGTRVDVAGIARGDGNVPVGLSEPFQVAQPIVAATQVVWVDQTRLGVLGRSTDDAESLVYLAPVGGATSRTSSVEGVSAIAAGGTMSSLLLDTSDGTLWSYGAASLWTKVTGQVELPTYAG